ncbi:hypothetical protein AVEN_171293-1 [Araneus ventricosus]|uniref:Uncharacterized protein n=1 Tax=Araneus ventricosus TaxID=182803 RepID=A0A4Y2KI11_ARAVE|nr:hypothetical protein AVEN_171293-1 [Araneus ventricosus]
MLFAYGSLRFKSCRFSDGTAFAIHIRTASRAVRCFPRFPEEIANQGASHFLPTDFVSLVNDDRYIYETHRVHCKCSKLRLQAVIYLEDNRIMNY